jgi:hypothetical protein
MRFALVLAAGAAFAALSSPASAQSAPPPSPTLFDVVEEILERVASPSLEHVYDAGKTAREAQNLVRGEEEEGGEEFRCKFLRVIRGSHEICLQH